MRSQIFDPAHPITILIFLPTIEMFCDASDIHEGASMFLSPSDLKKTTKEVLTENLTTKGVRRNNRGNLAPYPEVLNYLLRTYSKCEVTVGGGAHVTHYDQPDRMHLRLTPMIYGIIHLAAALCTQSITSRESLSRDFTSQFVRVPQTS